MNTRVLAVFDFDDTLIEGDSFWPFLVAVAGFPQALGAFGAALVSYVTNLFENKIRREDFRTFIKTQLIERLLTAVPAKNLAPAIDKLRRWQKWNVRVKQILLEHRAEGHSILIVSGALDLYLPELIQELPYDDLICTKIGVEGGMIMGEMLEGNCARERKAELLAAWLSKHEPFDDSWGYGNFPYDLPMLALLKHRIII
jgi:HAD superfamily phosphoserine phosphatase-like hydrolase